MVVVRGAFVVEGVFEGCLSSFRFCFTVLFVWVGNVVLFFIACVWVSCLFLCFVGGSCFRCVLRLSVCLTNTCTSRVEFLTKSCRTR